jgi:hypothetical protein
MSANAYGTIGVCGGYEGDLKRIVDILNDWRGEDESNYFVEEGVISINASEDEYPDIWHATSGSCRSRMAAGFG